MRRKFGYLVGFGGAVAMLSFIASLEVEVAAARGVAAPAAINRTLKGDQLLPVTGQRITRPASSQTKVPNECRTTFSMFAAEVAGRCVG